MIIAMVPIYNTDGNEQRCRKTTRPGQVGPEEGMGPSVRMRRALISTRDFMKLEATGDAGPGALHEPLEPRY